MKSKCIYVHCLTAMDGLRFKEHIAAGHCNGQQTKPRTSEEMDGTLPRIFYKYIVGGSYYIPGLDGA